MSGTKRMDQVQAIHELDDDRTSDGGTGYREPAGELTTRILRVKRDGQVSPLDFASVENRDKAAAIRASGRTWLSVYSVIRRYRAGLTAAKQTIAA